ncbi:MAG TPA: hypothetical protein HA224_04620 [Nanoarchaeota archaeon]|nr:hypothetical protein [Nanoarchaeota archaeon]
MPEEQHKWIHAKLIVEIAGSPESHVADTLKLIVNNFAIKNPEVKVKKSEINAPKKMPESQNFFSGFIEFEVEVASLSAMLGLILDYMPSSIDIISPENITENCGNLADLLNDLAGRLHQYDATVKTLKAEKAIIERELKKRGVDIEYEK